MRMVVLGIQLQSLAEQGYVERAAEAVVPGLLLLQVVDNQLASAGQQIVVLCQSVNGTVALACRQSQIDYFVRHQLQVETGCHKRTVTAAVVGSHTSHRHHLVVQVVGVLGVCTRRGLLVVMGQVIMIQRQTGREVVLLSEVGLEQQLGVGILLVHTVVLVTIVGIKQVHRGVAHDGDVGAVLSIEDEGVLHVAVVAVGLDAYLIQTVGAGRSMMRLSTLTLLFHHADATVEHVVLALPFPTVLQIPLAHVGLVQKTVIVLVVVPEVVLIVSKHLGTQLVVQMYVAIGISFHTAHRVAIEVHRHALVVVGLQVLNVYLSCYTLIAISHRRRTLRHLDAVHPRARNVVEGIGGGGAAEVGQVLGQHLHVGAAQPQQLYLLGSRGGIAVVHVHGGVGGEALAKVATGGLEQLFTPYQHGVCRSGHTLCSCAARGYSNVLNVLLLVNLQRVIVLSGCRQG